MCVSLDDPNKQQLYSVSAHSSSVEGQIPIETSSEVIKIQNFWFSWPEWNNSTANICIWSVSHQLPHIWDSGIKNNYFQNIMVRVCSVTLKDLNESKRPLTVCNRLFYWVKTDAVAA